MDETQEPGATPADDAAAAQPVPEPAPDQQVATPGLPSGSDIQATDQNPDNPTPEPEAQVEAATPEAATPEAAAPDAQNAPQAPEQADPEGAATPLPRPKPERLPEATATAPTAEAPTTVADATLKLKPGSVIRGAKELIPIPAPKPQMP